MDTIGLGGDHRLYDRMTDLLYRIAILLGISSSLLPFHDAAFAKRCVELGITDGDQLIGSSFGGMVAAEITHMVNIDWCLLLGTALALTNIEINRLALLVGFWMRHFGGRDIPANQQASCTFRAKGTHGAHVS